MRVLVIPVPSAGHLFAYVPLCWALRAEGHEVLVASRPDIAAVARGAGLNTVDVDLQIPLEQMRKAFTEDMFPATPFGRRDTPQGRGFWQIAARNWYGHAESHLDLFLAVARRWHADVVLTDPLALVGRMVGAALGVPTVVHRWGIDPTGGPFTEAAGPLLAGLADRLGLGGLPDPDLVVDICPPSLQALDAVPGRPVRFAPYNGAGPLPEWAGTRVGATRRVAVCFGGTVLSLAGTRALHRLMDALDGVPDAEVTAVFTASDRRVVGDLPARVRVLEQVPLNLFLDDVDVLLHHGGSTTGLTGIRYGLPQLVLPQIFDQFDYGQRLAAAGAGITVEDAAGQADVGRLREAVRSLLDDPGYTDAAERLRAEMDAAPPVSSLVADLESLRLAARR